MKTLIVKSIMMVVVIVFFVHYALYLRTGKIPWADWKGPTFELPTSVPGVSDLVPTSKTRVYKWVDEHGVVNYSQEPPPANYEGQTLEVDANVNLIQGTPLPEPEEATGTQTPRSVLLGEKATDDSEKTPIEKAQEVKDLLEARDREQKKILDSL